MKKHYKKNLTKHQKQLIAPFAAFEATALFIAWTDIIKAPSFRHGNRITWLIVSLLQPFGPWLYQFIGKEK
ncbi:hypothetical protein [Lentilactobacillus kosonis]|uniref:Cardiolipin synthase N-terminal domain-containing protein n=1 Tax=Lentilactobacillus kosonis TaxID=2810561 RepID=A0A401FJD2_9LACO|nr:hypothetical protein [Lentilactobacillus kosonis]GAY72398.1 hypothetical protein NBRC111893_544 [Lentilactobacillus kosonis]